MHTSSEVVGGTSSRFPMVDMVCGRLPYTGVEDRSRTEDWFHLVGGKVDSMGDGLFLPDENLLICVGGFSEKVSSLEWTRHTPFLSSK